MLLHRRGFRCFYVGQFWDGHNISLTTVYKCHTRLSLLLPSVTFFVQTNYLYVYFYSVKFVSSINSNRHPVETLFIFWLKTSFRAHFVGMFRTYPDLQFHIFFPHSLSCNSMKKYGRLTSLIVDYYLLLSVTMERDYINPSNQSRHCAKTVLLINQPLKEIVRRPKSKKRLPAGLAGNKIWGTKDKNIDI
jgi:hypothetical protein